MVANMRYIVDRIEGEIAVLERDDLTFVDVSLLDLPDGTDAGDCLLHKDGVWSLDMPRAQERKRRIEQKRQAVFRKPC